MKQGWINFHQWQDRRGADFQVNDRRGADFPRGGDWCATKELTEHCSSSVTVVGYDLVVSHTKLLLTVLHLAFQLKFSNIKSKNNTNVQCALRYNFFLGSVRKLWGVRAPLHGRKSAPWDETFISLFRREENCENLTQQLDLLRKYEDTHLGGFR